MGAVGLHVGQQVQDLLLDARAAVRLHDLQPARADGDPDRAVVGERPNGDRGGRRDRGLDRCRLPHPGVRGTLEVEHDPQVGSLLEVELLDLELAVAGAREPMHAADRVAVDVGPDRADERRGRLPALAARRGAVDRRRRHAPQRQRHHLREDHDAGRLAHHHLGREEAERITGAHLEGAEPVGAAAQQRHLGHPLPARVGGHTDRAPGERRRQVRFVAQLDPWLRPAGPVVNAVDALEHLPDMRPRIEDVVAGAHAAQPVARVEPRPQDQEREEVDEEEEEVDPGREGGHDEHRGREEESELMSHRGQVPAAVGRFSRRRRAWARRPAPAPGSRARWRPGRSRAGSPGSSR